MNILLLVRLIFAPICFFLLTIPVQAQQVAILDQGYNTKLIHKAKNKFVTQHCVSYKDDLSFQAVHPDGHDVLIFSLCKNKKEVQFFDDDAAEHPRNLFLFQKNIESSKKLEHARTMSNAVWEFESTLTQQHFQVFGFPGWKDPNGAFDTEIKDHNNSLLSR